MSDFSSTSAGDLRKMLIDSGKYSVEEAEQIKGKSKLVEAVLSLNESDEDNDNIFAELMDNMEKPTSILDNLPVKKETEGPDYNSPDWHEFVMSHFTEREVDGEYPTLYGLRRVAELLLGSIIQSGPTHIDSPKSENSPGRATCVYTVVFDWGESGQERAFSAVGGAYEGNTDAFYAIFPEAIAEARAEARALRKALKLRVMAAEEAPKTKAVKQEIIETVSTGEWNADDKITAHQVVFIKQKCKEMNIDVSKLTQKEYKKEIEEMNKGEGKECITLMNTYQTSCKSSLDVPDDIKVLS